MKHRLTYYLVFAFVYFVVAVPLVLFATHLRNGVSGGFVTFVIALVCGFSAGIARIVAKYVWCKMVDNS